MAKFWKNFGPSGVAGVTNDKLVNLDEVRMITSEVDKYGKAKIKIYFRGTEDGHTFNCSDAGQMSRTMSFVEGLLGVNVDVPTAT